METEMKRQMTNVQKSELIYNNPSNAFYKLITSDNYQFFSDAFYIAEKTIIEITGCYNTDNSIIAQKQVLLHMLSMELL